MCLRVNVQCANCFDLSRNKSDWHFISIFVGHNRPVPCIADRAPFCRRYYFQKRNARTRCSRTRQPNYFDLFRVSLIHRETLFFFVVAFFFSFFFYLRFFFISRTHNAVAGAIYFAFIRPSSVLLSSVLYALTFSQYSRKMSVQNVCIHTHTHTP